MTGISAASSTGRWSTRVDVLVIAFLFTLIGLWYAGSDFVAHFDSALPSAPAGGGTAEMIPGDQFEQFYRHTLPYHNLQRGQSAYYSGYQYALGQEPSFYEGWIFLPFSLLTSMLALFLGPVGAYNLVALLSFPLAGIFGYLLGKEVGLGSRAAGYTVGAVFAFLPFRVSFLFGEMVYATDVVLLPLVLFAFVRFLKGFDWRWSAIFFFSAFLLSAANFALFYWFILFFSPLFLVGAFKAARSYGRDVSKWTALLASALPSLAMTAWNLATVYSILSSSGLAAGQDLNEVRYYSPGFEHLITKWSGNEKTIYLGLAGILAALGWLVTLIRRGWGSDPAIRLVVAYSALVFPLAYVLAFGMTFDDRTGIGLYRFFYENVPGVSSSRTPGRIMPVVTLAASVMMAVACAWATGRLRNRGLKIVIGALLVYAVVVDFHFSDARMSQLVGRNAAYAQTAGKGGVVAIPFQREADHYLNATFQYFALVNDARLVNGHSSMYPSDWNAFSQRFYGTLNQGIATKEDLQDLRGRGVRFIAVHSTPYQPSVGPVALRLLSGNPALSRVAEERGVVLFEIVDPTKAPASYSAGDIVGAMRLEGGRAEQPVVLDQPDYALGWYAREAYPDQAAFRWMSGLEAVLLIPAPAVESGEDYVFRYKCPTGELSLEANTMSLRKAGTGSDGWTSVVIDAHPGETNMLTLRAPEIYRVPTDTRQFGCMIGDIEEKRP
ncbi:hypothetical protein [Pseudoxanthomonas sp. PXM01]|uniref:hypothetical protein n=1 Tax=Pseudoxanthomonas sp. PXM01 TaxID=2769295 RepID=UPI00177D0886|nr:hypothetical protein [Pseudoxanthomonas sp. PXM01]MBD9468873.1 hypothetical protein [Pseudoxanthomonas sp. PXM01]